MVVVVDVDVVPVVPVNVVVEGLGLQVKPLPVFLSHAPTRTSKPQQTPFSHGAQVFPSWYVSPRQLANPVFSVMPAEQSGVSASSISRDHADHSDHEE